MIAVVKIDQSHSNILLIFDCDWSILTVTITYAYAIVEWALGSTYSPGNSSDSREETYPWNVRIVYVPLLMRMMLLLVAGDSRWHRRRPHATPAKRVFLIKYKYKLLQTFKSCIVTIDPISIQIGIIVPREILLRLRIDLMTLQIVRNRILRLI